MRYQIATAMVLLTLSLASGGELSPQSLYDQAASIRDKLLSRAKDEAQDAAVQAGILQAECDRDRKFDDYGKAFLSISDFEFNVFGKEEELIKELYLRTYEKNKTDWKELS